jgi:hypothetical protein
VRVSKQELASSILVVAGSSLIVTGAALMHPAAGFAVAGVALIWIGWPR